MSIELGLAKAIDAETFGQPGQRTFRLRIIGENAESASLWMEKEQFQALSLALGQVLSELRDPGSAKEPPFYEFPEIADHDFKVGRMALGLDTADRTVVLYISETEAQDDDEPTLRVRLSQDHWGTLRGRLDEIIARGRPVCPLCNAPMVEGGHACIRGNGHSTQPIPEDDSGEGDDA
jgi:uncharacterized repeat protein (TIGR03847 family)